MLATSSNKSASAQKLNVSLKSTDGSTPPITVTPTTVPEYNFIINSELFLSLITTTGRFPGCIESTWTLGNLISEKMGLAQFFNIYCNDYGWNQKYCSSKECSRDSNSSERNIFDLNKRTLIAFREEWSGLCCNDNVLSVYKYTSTNDGPNNLPRIQQWFA